MEDGIREIMAAQQPPYDFAAFEKYYVAETKRPAGKIGMPTDIAYAVALLASPLASFITAINLRVDGGIVARAADCR